MRSAASTEVLRRRKKQGKPGKPETFVINFSMVSLQTVLTHLGPVQPQDTCSRPLVDNHTPQAKPQEGLGTRAGTSTGTSPPSVNRRHQTSPQMASPNWFKAWFLLFLLIVKWLINVSTFQKGRRTQQLQTWREVQQRSNAYLSSCFKGLLFFFFLGRGKKPFVHNFSAKFCRGSPCKCLKGRERSCSFSQDRGEEWSVRAHWQQSISNSSTVSVLQLGDLNF